LTLFDLNLHQKVFCFSKKSRTI